MYDSDVTILVNSCDLYEDAWYPFFRLLKTYWPECTKYPIVLNTEKKHFHCDFLDIRTFCGGKSDPWSKRLKNCLKTINTKYIVFFLEDFFLMKPVNNEVFLASISLLERNSSIGIVNMVPGVTPTHPYWKTRGQFDYYFTEIVKSKARINAMTAIWRRDFLLKIIKEKEDPWEFEKYATIRSKYLRKKVFAPVFHMENSVFCYKYLVGDGIGITSKKWLPKTKDLFEKHNIIIDYSKLGWYDIVPKKQNVPRIKRTKKELLLLAIIHPKEFYSIIRNKIRVPMNAISDFFKAI